MTRREASDIMYDRQRLVDRAQPRCCAARHVTSFDRDDVINRLYANDRTQSDFRIVSQVARPTYESLFDVCMDAVEVHVSVLCWEEGAGDVEGSGNNVVEVIVAPYDDEVGFLQFGVGPGLQPWFNHHWPYRDRRRNLTVRPAWRVEHHVAHMGETTARFVFFHFQKSTVVPQDGIEAVGFNVMRTHMPTGESATWSYASGSGFPDATGMGRVALHGALVRSPAIRAFRAASFQLQVTYDFPDELLNAPYTSELLREEFGIFRDAGVSRIYWIDYPFLPAYVRALTGPRHDLAAQTLEALDGDPTRVASQLARDMGIEFYIVIKPYDLWCHATRPFADETDGRGPRSLGGYTVTPDRFVAAHPELAMRRNPAWMPGRVSGPLTSLRLYADNDAPLAFDAAKIELYFSSDNAGYDLCEKIGVTQRVVERPRHVWTPPGKSVTHGEEKVRCIELSGFCLDAGYLAVKLPPASQTGNFGNQGFRLIELQAGTVNVPMTLATAKRGDDFRQSGFEFGISPNSAIWSDQTEIIEMRRNLFGGDTLGIGLGHDLYKIDMLEPGFSEVRDYWLRHYVQRAIDVGVDGIDVRIAHHHGCPEWLSYAWAEPVLEAFRLLVERDPQTTAEDYEQARRIRGGFHTQFLRDAGTLLRNAGMKLEHHVESRMTTPPKYDTYTQIHWDYATWIDEGIVDGINLKYLGPFNPWVHREILPRAKARGIPVHMIAAIGDPRRQPRTPEWTIQTLDMAHQSGFNGLNLYEAWVYLRTTPARQVVRRGCTARILEALKH